MHSIAIDLSKMSPEKLEKLSISPDFDRLTSSPGRRTPPLRKKTQYVFDASEGTYTVIQPPKPEWEAHLYQHYPKAMREEVYLKHAYQILETHGFSNQNTLACVSVCRDEMCSPFLNAVDALWRTPFMHITDEVGDDEILYTHPFVMSSLAGMLLLGRTGMAAAFSHAPKDVESGRQRYVFFVMPHVGLNEKGALGEVDRPGQDKPSSACGALAKFHHELTNGFLDIESDPTDVEYSILKQKLLKKIKIFGTEDAQAPTIKKLTEYTYQVIKEDLHRLLSVIDTKTCDYAVCAGIQIHTPGGASYIQPMAMYVVANEERVNIDLTELTCATPRKS